MEEMPLEEISSPPFSPQLLAAQCPASFRTLNVTSSEVCLASLSRRPTPPLFPYPLCRALMKTGNPHRCVHICIKWLSLECKPHRDRAQVCCFHLSSICTSHSIHICRSEPFLPQVLLLLGWAPGSQALRASGLLIFSIQTVSLKAQSH